MNMETAWVLVGFIEDYCRLDRGFGTWQVWMDYGLRAGRVGNGMLKNIQEVNS